MGKLIFSIIALTLSGIVFFMYTKPTYADIGAVQAQISQYQQALDKAAQLQALKQKLLTQYNNFDPNNLNRLQVMLPDHVDNIALILDLDNLASRYGMALENVDISTTDANGGTPSTVGAVGSANAAYDSIAMRFSTYGTYDNFKSFLTDLEQSLRIVDLSSLTISPQGTSATGALTYQYDISIKTYWLR